MPIVAAVSLTEDDHPLRVRLTPVSGFTLKAISAWAKDCLAPGSTVEIFISTFDLDVSLVHPPAPNNRALILSENLFQQW
ncbi:hypothetical protein NSMM_570005 [Nitrosomonas mobilis]|uniref:Uncharacterized protein n=1 Tax=Nitrosomonas mobilis TaxID=51642 RepID=A0A1G5SHZ6_9PROT|nr:hypothetical protein NSMM_570005 [Nitrosomonas mobilis]